MQPGARASSGYHHEYWRRLRKLDYDFLRGPLSPSIATALRFTLSVDGVHTAIVGSTNAERWRQNAALLAQGPLPKREIDAIRRRWRAVATAGWTGQT
jgi:aryl-alcohol dehydrogenase-like predicted oxidoreductase